MLDETYFAESFKGNHTNSSTFTMPRPPHKRGRVCRPNLEEICVLSGVNDQGTAFFELAGRGSISNATSHVHTQKHRERWFHYLHR